MANHTSFRRSLSLVAAIFVCTLPVRAANRVVIVQTNSAGDSVHIIDPATNKVVGEISGIEVNHGAAVAPDGSRRYRHAAARQDVAHERQHPQRVRHA